MKPRTRIWHKLVVICAAFTVPLALTTWFLLEEKDIKIDFAEAELAGDEYLRPLSRLLVDVSAHRYVLRQRPTGAGPPEGIGDLEARIDREFGRLLGVDRRLRGALLTTAEDLAARGRADVGPARLARDWKALTSGASDRAARAASHDRLIVGLRTLIAHVGDTSKLILDPDLDSYYVMDALLIREPELVDRLSRLGDAVDVVLRDPTAGPSARIGLIGEVAVIAEETSELEYSIRRAVAETGRFNRNQALDRVLSPALDLAVGTTRDLVERTTADVVGTDPPRVTPADYAGALRRAVDAHAALWSDLFDQEDVMLRARQAGDLDRRRTALASVAVVLVAIVALALVIARRIAQDVGAVASAARALAEGDLARRVSVRSRDEVGALADGFNVMAERLGETYAGIEETVRQRTAELAERNASVQLLQDVAVGINAATHLDEATQVALDLVCTYTGWPVGHAYQVRGLLSGRTGDGPELLPTGLWHLDDPERFATFRRVTGETPLPRGVGLPGRVLASGTPAWIVDVSEDPNFPQVRHFNDPGVRAGMAFPVLVGDEVVGVLEFFSPDAVEPDPALLELMGNVGTQLGRMVDRARAQRALQRAKEEADAASEAKSRFLARMSHELRTPLNAILGYAQILERDTTLSERQRNGVTVMHRSGEHLLGLINRILDLFKVEFQKLELQPHDFRLRDFLEDIAATFAVRAHQKGLSYRQSSDPDLPPYVHGDEQRLRQVLFNLIGNAVKFTDHGEVVFTVEALGPRVRFAVEDTGRGVPPEELEQIFQAFHQVGDQVRAQEGAGLGLAISHGIVELMGGTVEVASTPGQGSRFWFDIPLPEAAAPKRALPTAPGILVGYLGPRRRILVVDDFAEGRALLADLLEPLGFLIAEAENGQEALNVAQEFHPDAILMDLRMPVMDGYEATRRIRAITKLQVVVIIGVSASAFGHHKDRCLEAGADDFLPKPFPQERLFELLARYLGLEWRYAPGATASAPEASALVFPPSEVLTRLLTLARSGDIKSLLDEAHTLEPDYPPFAQELRALAQGFQVKRIVRWLEGHGACGTTQPS